MKHIKNFNVLSAAVGQTVISPAVILIDSIPQAKNLGIGKKLVVNEDGELVPHIKVYENGAWSEGTAPSAEDDVVIKSNLMIDGVIEVNGLTIDPGVKVTIEDNGSLSINGKSDAQANYGDLIINAGGQVILESEADLKVGNFIIESSIDKSGQLHGTDLTVNGEAFIDVKLAETVTKTWYDFALPFDVDITTGIYRMNGTTAIKMTALKDYYISAYSEARRAANSNGWDYQDDGTIVAGYQYMIYLNNTNSNVIRFKAVNKSAIIAENDITVFSTPGGEIQNQGWNVIGNNKLYYATPNIASDAKVQFFNPTTNHYETLQPFEIVCIVGKSFAIQVAEQGTISFNAPSTIDDPEHTMNNNSKEFTVILSDNSSINDRMFLSANSEATNTYQIGHDYVKTNTTATSKVAQLWATAYGLNLCDVELPFDGNRAVFPISMYAPAAGNYNLHVTKTVDDQKLYLLEDGIQICDLTMSDYTVSLNSGTTTNYSLMITRL